MGVWDLSHSSCALEPPFSLRFLVLEVSVDMASSSEILSSDDPFKGILRFFYSVFDLWHFSEFFSFYFKDFIMRSFVFLTELREVFSVSLGL